MEDHARDMEIQNGMVTFPRSGITLDLVWGNAQMEQSIMKRKVAQTLLIHPMIRTMLDLLLCRSGRRKLYELEFGA
jgi:hypothetical protein